MAIAVTSPTSGQAAAATTATTASVSPAAGSMVVLYVTWAVSGGSATPTITGLSGTSVNKASTATGGSSSTKIGIWTCTNFSGSGTILITFASGSNTSCWSVSQVTGADNVATPVQVPITSKSVTSTAATCAYATAANSANLFLYGCAGPGFFTQLPNESGTLWTELSDNSQATPSCSLEVQVSPDVTNLTGASTLSATSVDTAVGFEIAIAPAAGAVVTPLPVYAPGWFPAAPSAPGGEPFTPWPLWEGTTPGQPDLLNAATAVTATGAAALNEAKPLNAAQTVTATRAAVLTEAKPLNAATTVTASRAAAETTAKPLNAAQTVTATAAASLDVVKAGVAPVPQYPPVWFPRAPGVPGGEPFAPWPVWTGFAGTSIPVDLLNAAQTVTAARAAALTEAKPLNAATTVTATVTASLTTAKPLNAATTVTAARTAAETTAKPVNAAATVTATLAASLTTVAATPSAVTAPPLYLPSWFPGAPTVPAAEPFAPWPVWTGAPGAVTLQNATSAPAVTDPRDGTASVSGAVSGALVAAGVTSAPAVADPRDGAASVTGAATSTPSVSDG